jgi:ribonuclease D
VCDPDTIGLPAPASLTPARAKRPRAQAAALVDPGDVGLLETLRQWRVRASNGKPAYTVAHNSTLESIAALRPRSLAELATINGVGPAFVKRHGQQVLALVAETATLDVAARSHGTWADRAQARLHLAQCARGRGATRRLPNARGS